MCIRDRASRQPDRRPCARAAQRAGTERQTVDRGVLDGQQPGEIIAVLDDARQAEDRAGRVVGMDRHLDANFFSDWNDFMQEAVSYTHLDVYKRQLYRCWRYV